MTGAPATKRPRKASPLPVVAIVGRPNVGKSALFNRMIGRRKALVEDLAGTTRDRLYGEVVWGGERFRLVDTGGLEPDGAAGYPKLVREQVEQAVAEASVLLFVVDAEAGLIESDRDVAGVLRRAGKPVFLLANKAESEPRREAAVQFYELGLGEPIAVSAHHGAGVAEVLDLIIEALPPAPEEEAAVDAPRIAIVGRPNVGKSMLLNAVLGEERVIVSPVPGTTRDAIDTTFAYKDQTLVFVDTAGLRRAGKIGRGLERHAAMRAREALDRADVAVIVFDAAEGLTAQDLHVLGFALKAKTAMLLVANKWDLISGVTKAEFEQSLRRRLYFAPWISFCIVSAKERMGIKPLLRDAVRLWEERRRHIETGRLNSVVQRAIAERPPPTVRNRRLKLLYVSQPEVSPPTFVFFVNDASLVHFSYRRYVENVLRNTFGFEGVALRLTFRSRKER